MISIIVGFSNLQLPQVDPDELAGGLQFPYPYSKQETPGHKKDKQTTKNDEREKKGKAKGRKNSGPVEPHHRIVHRGHVDIQNFTNAR